MIFVTLYIGVATGGHRLRKQSTFILPTVTTGRNYSTCSTLIKIDKTIHNSKSEC